MESQSPYDEMDNNLQTGVGLDDAGESGVSGHDELMSNFFAQPDALAIGKTMNDLIQIHNHWSLPVPFDYVLILVTK